MTSWAAARFSSRKRDQVRRVQLGVLAVDCDEELDDLVRSQVVEDDGGDLEVLQVVLRGELVEGEEAVLSVERAQDPGLLGQLQRPGVRPARGRGELQPAVGNEQDASRNGRQRARVRALEVVRHELFDLLLDDRPLVGMLGSRDPLLQKLPVDAAGGLLLLAPGRLAARTEGKDLEPDEGLQVHPREKGLIEADAELVQSERGNGEHPVPP